MTIDQSYADPPRSPALRAGVAPRSGTVSRAGAATGTRGSAAPGTRARPSFVKPLAALDTGTPCAMRRRSMLLGGAGLAIAGALAACGPSDGGGAAAGAAPATGPAPGSAASGATAVSAVTTAAAAPEYHEASASSTALSAGSWSGAIGDKTMTLSGAHIVDGIEATIDGGTFESTSADEAVFLVVGRRVPDHHQRAHQQLGRRLHRRPARRRRLLQLLRPQLRRGRRRRGFHGHRAADRPDHELLGLQRRRRHRLRHRHGHRLRHLHHGRVLPRPASSTART